MTPVRCDIRIQRDNAITLLVYNTEIQGDSTIVSSEYRIEFQV